MLFLAGNRSAGVVVAPMPVAVFFLVTQVVGSLWFKPSAARRTGESTTLAVSVAFLHSAFLLC
jgi:hypothetical protein